MTDLRTTLAEAWEQTKALGLAVGVHLLAAALIVLGTLEWRPFKPQVITGMTIEAVLVDTQALKQAQEAERRAAAEAMRQQQQREQRQRELNEQQDRDRQTELERQQQVQDQQRKEAEAAEAKRQQELEKKRQADLRLKELRERQERQQQEELKRQQDELEKIQKQRAEAEKKRKIEEERLKQLDALKEQEAANQRQAENEAALKAQVEAEAAAQRAGQLGSLRDQYRSAIQVQVTNNWLRPPTAQAGLRCAISIVQIPGGEVISATIKGSCNADEATRRSLIAAVERAGSLPYRGFETVFEREIDFNFAYDGD